MRTRTGSGARPRVLALALAAAVLAIAGCSGGHGPRPAGAGSTASTATTVAASGTTVAATSTTAASYQARVLAWGRELARCARAHGQPNFPDPRFYSGDDPGVGGAEFPGVDKLALERAQEACLAIVRRMPPPQPTRPPPAETLRQMRRFSQCMREHGVGGQDPEGHPCGAAQAGQQ